MTDTPKTKRAFIIRNFNDAGTGQNFTAGSIVPIEEGSFANYAHAGLVRVATSDDSREAVKAPPATEPAVIAKP